MTAFCFTRRGCPSYGSASSRRCSTVKRSDLTCTQHSVTLPCPRTRSNQACLRRSERGGRSAGSWQKWGGRCMSKEGTWTLRACSRRDKVLPEVRLSTSSMSTVAARYELLL